MPWESDSEDGGPALLTFRPKLSHMSGVYAHTTQQGSEQGTSLRHESEANHGLMPTTGSLVVSRDAFAVVLDPFQRLRFQSSTRYASHNDLVPQSSKGCRRKSGEHNSQSDRPRDV